MNESEKFNRIKQEFLNPKIEDLAIPFWAWNGKLEPEELKRQIDIMKQMHYGGFFMHSRTGLETEYLGEEWFQDIRDCAVYGYEQGMSAWLYDEDRWPSGSAGGMAAVNPVYRAHFLRRFTKEELEDCKEETERTFIAAFACTYDVSHELISYRLLQNGEEVKVKDEEVLETFVVEEAKLDDNYNGYTYIDTMSREAVGEFIRLTHEAYQSNCGDLFGKEIAGIFTDEPHRGAAFSAFSGGSENGVPWTPLLFAEFSKRFGYDLENRLPELFSKVQGKAVSRVTRDYFELTQELFLENYAKQYHEWCKENGLLFTGHVLHEDCLVSQAAMQGSLMRFYEYQDIPGVDVLTEGNTCHWIAKQIQSVCRQLGKKEILSELNGVSGWQCSLESYKNIGDWQALFGINVRCPHLSWYTMKGEAKRDYPASLLHQSAWYPYNGYLEDYFARIGSLMKKGEPDCELLVVSPIESVWARAYAGAFDGLVARDSEIVRLEERYAEVFHYLAESRIDFDYGEEDVLLHTAWVEDGMLVVGKMRYRKVLLAGVDTLRESTVKLLEEFIAAGGIVISAGEAPAWMDCEPSERLGALVEQTTRVAFTKEAVASACASGREIRILGAGEEKLYAQVRLVSEGRIVMLLNTDRENGGTFTIHFGSGDMIWRLDPRSGKTTPVLARKEGQDLVFDEEIEGGGERLYFVQDGIPYHLTEPNVCVLDRVSVTAGGKVLAASKEVLKADRLVRDRLGLSYRGGEMLQPWYEKKLKKRTNASMKEDLTDLTLEYSLYVETVPEDVKLVFEDPEHIKNILVNGEVLQLSVGEYWIDICFHAVPLPVSLLKEGENRITVEFAYERTTGLEAMYLIGNFGVNIEKGIVPTLTKLPKRLHFGDITPQGLPFYSAGVVYEIDIAGELSVGIPAFEGSLAVLHGKQDAILGFSPYRGRVKDLTGIEVVLTRRNTFGPLHQIPVHTAAYGPGNFVLENKNFSERFALISQGLVKAPVFELKETIC